MHNPVINFIKALLLLVILFISAQTNGCEAATLGQTNALRLKAGVNFGEWFWSPNHYTNLNNITFSDKDFDTLHNYGVSHVRLPISPSVLFTDTTYKKLNIDTIKKLDNFVWIAKRKNIIVILDIHPTDSTEKTNVYSKISTIWTTFMPHAQHFPDTVFLETLNEPNISSPTTWRDYQTNIINVIRKFDSQHTIIVDGLYSSYYTGLSQLKPLDDQNVIYSFHYYNPMTFTHQGAVWAGVFGKFNNIHYPTNPLEILAIAQTIPQSSWGGSITYETQVPYTRDLIIQELGKPVVWAKQYNVPIYCGEFGAIKTTTPYPDRIIWYQDVMNALSKYNIPFAMWSYIGYDFPLDPTIMSSIKASGY